MHKANPGFPVFDKQVLYPLKFAGASPCGRTGISEKTALLRRDGRWFKPAGTTATTHILKPKIGQLPNGIDLSNSVKNEYFCLKLTAALGLPSAPVEIADFGDRRALVVERFDRQWARDGRLLRLPQEDCWQALSVPPTRKYESDDGPGIRDILKVLKGSDEPEADQRLFLQAQIAFWLMAATDGHAKNFSVFLSPGGRFRLTPLYDVISAQPSADTKQIRRRQMKLAMAVGNNRHYATGEIAPRHFVQTAARAGAGKAAVDAALADIAAAMPQALADVTGALPAGFPGGVAASINAGVRARLRLFDHSHDC